LTRRINGCKIAQMKQTQLDPLVKEIAAERIKQMLDASLRDIQQEVYKRTGETPSTSVLSASLQRLGMKASGHRWVYRHNEGKQ